jgi:hypothetical protein
MIWFLPFLSDNSNGEGWIWSLHSGFDEDDDSDVNNFLCMMTWRIRVLNEDIKVGMILPSWKFFLQFLVHFVVVRSDHNEWLVRINLSLKPILIGFELGRLRLIFLLLGW